MSSIESIIGYVTSTSWDKRGNILEICIETEDFQKYPVIPEGKGRELFDFIDVKIQIWGDVKGEDIHGNKVIAITGYEVIKETYLES